MARRRHLIVVGSGAAGMACALAARREGADVTVLEATGMLGGTTAVSGGAIWAPANPWAAAAGVEDSQDDALAYLAALERGDFDAAKALAYVRRSSSTLRQLEDSSSVRWEMQPGWPDYHAELDGARTEGRSLEIGPVEVGAEALASVRLDPYGTPPMTVNEERSSSPPDAAELGRREQAGVVARGRGLIAALHDALRQLGADVRRGVRVEGLLVSGGAVRGVMAGGEIIEGNVALTTGGFERDPALVRRFLRGPMNAPGGVPSNRGDGLRMGMELGAAVGNMSEAWWCAALGVPGEDIDGEPFYRMLFLDFAAPGGVLVDDAGRRFVNEAANYNDLGRALGELDASTFRYSRAPSWYVFDSSRRARPFGPLGPEDADPAWLFKATTIGDLSRRIGLPASTLEASVDRFNAQVAAGSDADFKRGSYAFDRFSSGALELHGPTVAPFYAAKVMPGCLGTKGGLITDEFGRVVRMDGIPIEGLYAAGNATASPFGCAYPGGGATIGPALVYGWAAGETAAA